MRSILQAASWRFYHFVHTTGAVADLVYGWADPVLHLVRKYRYWKAVRDRVTASDLEVFRRFSPEAGLSTGVTNICNAKCTFCAYPKAVAGKTLQTGIMSFEVFKKAVDEWAANGGKLLDLTPVVGDPLVDPGLLQKVEYATRLAKIPEVFLTTNAILLSRNDTYKKLIDLGISAVFISTEGTDKATYEKVYGVNQYPAMLSGVRSLLEYNRQKGEPARIVIRFRNAQKPSQIIHSPDFNENIQPYLSSRVRVNFTVNFDNWGGTIQQSDLAGSMKLRKSLPDLNIPCRSLFRIAVRHDGSVRLCACRLTRSDMDGLIVGSIKGATLSEIAAGDKVWALVNAFYKGERPETCRNCTVYMPIDRQWVRKNIELQRNIALH